MIILEIMIPSLLWAFDFESSADLELHKDASPELLLLGLCRSHSSFQSLGEYAMSSAKLFWKKNFSRLKGN